MTDLTQLIDTVPSTRFPVYTRLNAGDVMPDPITPLGATLVWIPEVLPGTYPKPAGRVSETEVSVAGEAL